MSTEELIDLPSGKYVHAVTVVDSAGDAVYPTVAVSPEFEIAQTGLYKGRVANLGYSIARRSEGWSSTSVMGDVSNYLDNSQATNTPVVVGTTYYIRSSSVQDGVGGTGIRTMRVNLLDTNGYRTIRTITMNGTTSVVVGSDISFVQYMESETIGSGGTAAGDITISSVTGAPTVAQTIEKIVTGDSRSMSGRVKVPKDFSLYLRGWSVGSIGNTQDTRIRGQAFTNDRTLSPGFHFQQTCFLSNGQNADFPVEYLKFPEGAEIKISSIPGGTAAAANRCDGSFHFLLISNV